jgi:Putative restriction endonuclease
MPREAPVKTNLDFETFLGMEIQPQERHEFVDGHLFVMPGGATRHNEIAGQLIAGAFPAALEAGCRLLFNDVLVRTPDVFVACDAHDDHPRVKRNPCLIVEVLSEPAHGHGPPKSATAGSPTDLSVGAAKVMVWAVGVGVVVAKGNEYENGTMTGANSSKKGERKSVPGLQCCMSTVWRIERTSSRNALENGSRA